MNFTRRDFLRATAAAVALKALDSAWPFQTLAAAEPPGTIWTNKHMNLSERIWRQVDVWNCGPEGRATGAVWRGGLDQLSAIVREAHAAGRRVRAVGRTWSLSPCAVCPDVMVNTLPLNFHVVGMAAEDLSTSAYDPARLVFAQCGTSVRELSATLEEQGLSLPTSGASNGQTICGAISTGTHGSARRVGSMQDYMLGLHVIVESGEHYWIERASRPVASEAFCQKLGETLKRDDDLFRAAVVSFGSFGIIHAVLFEAAPGYLLEVHRRRVDWAHVADAAASLDTDGLGLPYPGVDPFHFDVSINPFGTGKGQRGAIVTAMYQKDFRALPPPERSDVAMVSGVDLLAVSGKLAKYAPGTIRIGVNSMFESMMKSTERVPLGTHGQVFPRTPMIGQSLSTEVGVDLGDARAATEILIDTANRYPFPGVFGLRFVQRSDAFLAFTKFDTTCTIEMTGAGGRRTMEFYRRAWAALDRAKIPVTMHWGKVNDTTCDNIHARWGGGVDRWITARQSFLAPAARRMFSNDLLTKCELHQ